MRGLGFSGARVRLGADDLLPPTSTNALVHLCGCSSCGRCCKRRVNGAAACDSLMNLSIVHDVQHVEVQVGMALGGSGHTVPRHIHTADEAAVFSPERVSGWSALDVRGRNT